MIEDYRKAWQNILKRQDIQKNMYDILIDQYQSLNKAYRDRKIDLNEFERRKRELDEHLEWLKKDIEDTKKERETLENLPENIKINQ